MSEGLLWLDDDPDRTTAEKVRRAAQRYEEKCGRPPTVCYCHRDVEPQTVDGVRLEPRPWMLRGHWQVGIMERGRDGAGHV